MIPSRWATVVILLAATGGVDAGPFDIGGEPAPHGVIARSATMQEDTPDAPMTRAVAGLLADLDDDDLERLRRVCRSAPAEPAPATAPVCFIHLGDANAGRILAVTPADDRYLLVEQATVVGNLPRDAIDRLLADGAVYHGSFEPVDSGGERFALEPPFCAAPIELDRGMLRRRVYRSINVGDLAAQRTLEEAVFRVRLPADYAPAAPAGLLVWVSPTPSGEIPALFDDVLDAMNLIAVGVDGTGNDRAVPDKLQLMLDAVATVSRRYHVDTRRVYVTGFSGGGKLGSVLAICFPDVFRGIVPVSGLATHAELGPSWGRHQQAYFARPKPPLLDLAQRRSIAPISGPHDFNYLEMKERAQLLHDDGFQRVRFFEHRELGHAMPPPALFRDAMEYVDEPYQVERAKERMRSERLLEAYMRDRPEAAPADEPDRDRLVEIMRVGPYTPAAWRAYELLIGARATP